MRRSATRTALLMFAIGVLVVGLAGCGGSSSSGTAPAATSGSSAPAATGVTITEKGFAFEPANATAKVGETVTFANEDSVPHEVLVDGKDLGTQQPGQSVTWTPTKAGTFPIACMIHPNMKGQITVQ
jgi:plastocyanin